jgi:hypothetical protein
MITLHVGHLLVDIVEQVFHTMMDTYGEVRTDSLFVFGVAEIEAREILREKLELNAMIDEYDTFGAMLKLFSDLPILSMDVFTDLQKSGVKLIFEGIHFGADISASFFHRGLDNHPCIFNMATAGGEVQDLSQKYRSFQTFALNSLGFSPANINNKDSFVNPSVLFIQRKVNRVIRNMDLLVESAKDLGLETVVQDLSDLRFSEQLQLFVNCDIMVAMAGTAVHNLLFMRPGSAVIIFMQPGWCDWAWMYANQAVLLDIHPVIYCSPSEKHAPQIATEMAVSDKDVDFILPIEEGFNSYHWTRNFWLQGPRMTKGLNVTVDIDIFSKLLKSVMELKTTHRDNSWNKHRVPICTGHKHSTRTESTLASKHNAIHDNSSAEKTKLLQRKPPFIPVMDVYISEVRSERIDTNAWKLAIMGEIVSRKRDLASIIRTMPHLSICCVSLLTTSPAWCYPVSAFNYYSDIYMSVVDPVHYLHFWAQTSVGGGKIQGSDTFVALDARQGITAGLSVHQEAINRNIRLRYRKPSHPQHHLSDVDIASGSDSRTPAAATAEVEVSEDIIIAVTSKYSLQRFISDFCRTRAVEDVDCGDLASSISLVAHKLVLSRQFKLPEVQNLPKPTNPFIFVHVEKTGGTTLRE